MKVPVPHPVRVPNLVVIMYNEIILFCGFFVLFSQEDFFLNHYRGMSLVLKLSK